MRASIALLTILLLASVAWADKPVAKKAFQPRLVPCNLQAVTHDWDFSVSSHGFYRVFCDEQQPPCNNSQVWEWGVSDYIGSPGAVWGTILEGDYPPYAGQALVSPSFMVDENSCLVEVHHFFQTESGYDGGNLNVLGTVVHPIGGYPGGIISSSPSYYTCCVDSEYGWHGDSDVWRVDCFDLSAFIGYEISLHFNFGSDSSVNYPGWYISRIRVGGAQQERVCCFPDDGHCELTPDWLCEESGGIWYPDLTSCDPNPCPQPCFLDPVMIDWDFSYSDHGFEDVDCDQSGMSVWQYGYSTYIPGAPGNTWGTVLNSDYYDNSGHGLLSPSFTVTESTKIVEIFHYYDIEYGWDGCNVSVGNWPNNTIIHPVAGYTIPEISPDPGYYAYCVDGEPGWTGLSGVWRIDCFDLSEWMGQSIELELDFGSDASVTAPGWYVSRIRVGGISEPAFEPILNAGPWINPEPWHDWIGPTLADPDTLRVPLYYYAPDPNNLITYVEFYWDSLGTWVHLATDFDGSEPWFDTVGDAEPVGDGWSAVASLPMPLPDPDLLRIKAVIHEGARTRAEIIHDHDVDPNPPSNTESGLSDWGTHDSDTLGVPLNPNGTDTDYVMIYRRDMEDAYEKGIPGISQQGHGEWHCAPTATAQCLKYFEEFNGDTEITGGLTDHQLVDALAAYMATNLGPDPGTYVSEWIGGLSEWIDEHGGGYTLRPYKHYRFGGWTWTEARDWKRMRDELQRSQDVLVGIFWEVSPGIFRGGHALTFDSLDNTPLPSGRILVGFKDPWTGTSSFGELDPETGIIHNLTGSGGGGNARIGVTLIVCPKEVEPGNMGGLIPVYNGPNPWPDPILIELPELGAYFVDQIIVNTAGHAHRISNIIIREEPGSVPGDDRLLPESFFLSQAAPNPFGAATNIAFAVPTTDHVRIEIYDVAGRKMKTLVHETVEPGFHSVVWDGRDDNERAVAAGVYYVRMVTSTYEMSRSLTLLR